MTNDPGKAIISGKCADTGKFTVPQLRALAPRAPFFSDGSAATLRSNQRVRLDDQLLDRVRQMCGADAVEVVR